MSLFAGALVLLLLSLAPVAIAVLLIARQMKDRDQESATTLTQPRLTSPGSRLRREISDLQFDLSLYVGLLCSIGPYLGFLVLVQAYLAQRALGPLDFAAFALSTIGLSALVLIKVANILENLKSSRHALECELSVGLELDQLKQRGYSVFQDVPCEDFNIDQVVVGRNGVFSITTKARSMPITEEGRECRITVDNHRINIPGKHGIIHDTLSVDEASRQCEQLGIWLSNALGEKVSVTPILVFPGWYVKNYNVSRITVLNEKQIRSDLPKLQGQRLADANVARLAHQLDLRVREIDEDPTEFDERVAA